MLLPPARVPVVDSLGAMQSSDWLAVREYLRRHRHQLTVRAARHYPAAAKVAGTPLLTAADWLPQAPVPLRDISIEFRADRGPGQGAERWPLPPTHYAQTMLALAPPAVFENRPTYRLTQAQLASPGLAGPGLPRLAFGPGRYFDGIDTGEAAAHEYAAGRTELRTAIGDPLDLARRPANLAISTLTICRDRTGRARFLLHWRDPAKVGHAGGMYQVVPAGVFQPPGFDLWQSMVREFAEELGGYAEHADLASFTGQLTGALDGGRISAWCLGLGVDPLSFATDLLTVVVFEEDLFGELFGDGTGTNAEGQVLSARTFDAPTVDRTVQDEPLQAAGAAVLRLAWSHRAVLIGMSGLSG